MRITNNMLWNNPGSRINASLWGSALTGQVGRRNTTSTARGVGNTNSFYNTFSNQMNSYAKIGSASEDLRSSAAQLSAKNNVMYDIAKHGGSRKGLLEQAKKLVDGYNSTINSLEKNPSALNNTYKKMLENAFGENSEALKGIGITVGKDKTVSIDEKKFNSVSAEKIEAALGAEGGFTSRVATISDGIGNSAMMNPYNSYMAYNRYGLNGYGSSALAGLGAGSSGYLSALAGLGAGNSSYLSALMGTGYGNSSYLSALMNSRYNFWT